MRTKGKSVLGVGDDRAIKQLAALMADTVTGDHDSQIVNFFASPLFGDREDLAYLKGSRAIQSLRLGPFGIRKLERHFKDALSVRGFSALHIDILVARFQVYYWTTIICSTTGKHRQLARKKVKKSRSIVEKLTNQIDSYPSPSP